MTFDLDTARDAAIRREERALLRQFDDAPVDLLREFCAHILETTDDPAGEFADVLLSPLLKARAIAAYCAERAERTVLALPDSFFDDPFGDAYDRARDALKEAA